MYNHLRKAWVALGEISSNGAMAGFCNLLETACPALVPWIRHKKRVRTLWSNHDWGWRWGVEMGGEGNFRWPFEGSLAENNQHFSNFK